MFVLITREPKPDAPLWSSRKWLAAIDAVVWPNAWVVVLRRIPFPEGVVVPMATAVAVLMGLERLHRALLANHRYWFTTWRWGRIALGMLVIGAVIKLATLS